MLKTVTIQSGTTVRQLQHLGKKKWRSSDGLICLLQMGHLKLNSGLTPPQAFGYLSQKMLFLKALTQYFKAILSWHRGRSVKKCHCPVELLAGVQGLLWRCLHHSTFQEHHLLLCSAAFRVFFFSLGASWFCLCLNRSFPILTISFIQGRKIKQQQQQKPESPISYLFLVPLNVYPAKPTIITAWAD